MRASLTVTAFAVATSLQAIAQQGPNQLPPGGSNNTVLPVVERPDLGWPSQSELQQSREEFCAPLKTAAFRITKITGDRSVFVEAQEKHRAWYEDYGYATTIVDLPVMLADVEEAKFEDAEGVSMTLTVYGGAELSTSDMSPGALRRSDLDAAAEWNAFVEAYQTSSEIIEEAWTCAPAELLED